MFRLTFQEIPPFNTKQTLNILMKSHFCLRNATDSLAATGRFF